MPVNSRRIVTVPKLKSYGGLPSIEKECFFILMNGGGGNCFWYCVSQSQGLFKNDLFYKRMFFSKINESIEEVNETFLFFCSQLSSKLHTSENEFNDLLTEHQKDGDYASNLILYLFSFLFDCTINVFMKTGTVDDKRLRVETIDWKDIESEPFDQPVLLDNNCFNILLEVRHYEYMYKLEKFSFNIIPSSSVRLVRPMDHVLFSKNKDGLDKYCDSLSLNKFSVSNKLDNAKYFGSGLSIKTLNNIMYVQNEDRLKIDLIRDSNLFLQEIGVDTIKSKYYSFVNFNHITLYESIDINLRLYAVSLSRVNFEIISVMREDLFNDYVNQLKIDVDHFSTDEIFINLSNFIDTHLHKAVIKGEQTIHEIDLRTDYLSTFRHEIDTLKLRCQNSSFKSNIQRVGQEINRLIKSRHDTFGKSILNLLSIPFKKEKTVLDCLRLLYQSLNEPFYSILAKSNEVQYQRIFRKTPDSFLLYDDDSNSFVDFMSPGIDKQQMRNLMNNGMLTVYVIDYAVSVNPDIAIHTKFQKYSVISEFIPKGIRFHYSSLVYDINKSRIVSEDKSFIEQFLSSYNMPTEFNDLIKAVTSFTEDYEKYVNQNFGSTGVKVLRDELAKDQVEFDGWRENLKCGVEKETFLNNKEVREALNEITPNDEELDRLIYFCDNLYDCPDNKKFKEAKSLLEKISRNVVINTSLMTKTNMHKSPFRKPTRDLIIEAFESLESKSAGHFEPLIQPKLIGHYPFYKIRDDKHKGTEKLNSFLKEYNRSFVNENRGNVNEYNNNVYLRFKFVIDSIKEKDNIIESLQIIFLPEHFTVQDQLNADPDIMTLAGLRVKNGAPEREEIEKGLKEKKELYIRIAKHGTVLVPLKSAPIASFCEEVKLGYKYKETPKEPKKVKSLTYWDPDYDGGYKEMRSTFIRKFGDNLIDNIEDYLKDVDTFYKNLAYISSFPSKGFRINFGSNPFTIGVSYPSKSIHESGACQPHVIITMLPGNMLMMLKNKQRNNDYVDFFDWEQRWTAYYSTEFDMTLMISKGKNDKHKTITPRCVSRARFHSLRDIIHANMEFSDRAEFDRMLKVDKDNLDFDLLCLTINININNSSLLDNLRYLVTDSVSDWSCADGYIKEKLLVACKNVFQNYIYKSSKELLFRIQDELENAIKSEGKYDDDGNLIEGTVKLENVEVSSLLVPNFKYKNIISLLLEVIALFFSTQKALHDQIHNSIEMHKTPIQIEMDMLDDIKKEIEDMEKSGHKFSFGQAVDYPIQLKRYMFNINFLYACSFFAQEQITTSSAYNRNRIVQHADINKHPLQVRTMTSTRSVLKEVNKKNFDNVDHAEMRKDLNELVKKLQNVMESNNHNKEKRKSVRDLKNQLKLKYDQDGRDNPISYYLSRIFINYRNKHVNIIYGNKKLQEFEDKLSDKVKHISSVVLTETINNIYRDKEDVDKSVGELAIDHLKKGDQIYAAIRPKGQRTQKDREIYVLNMAAKHLLFCVENTFSRLNQLQPQEKISIPGDRKIIQLADQSKNLTDWVYSTYNKERKNTTGELHRVLLHINADFTKWSPKDNVLKFIFTIATLYCLKPEEKYALIWVLIRHFNKKLFIDPFLLSVAMNSYEHLSKTVDNLKCVFKDASQDFTTCYFPISANWFQGQFNSLSSFVHAGAMVVVDESTRYEMGNVNMQINVHSDDNQTSVGYVGIHDEEYIMKFVTQCIIEVTSQICLELSIKKTCVSKNIKEFVSQINIMGNQYYYWVKPASVIYSGLPYTNLKDDMSSIYSKIFDALSHGAPPKATRSVMNDAIKTLLDIYGGWDETRDMSKFSRLLGVPKDILPVCLGGGNPYFPILGIFGPSMVDSDTIYKISKHYGASVYSEPSNRCLDESKRAQLEKAIKLFYIADQLSDTVVDPDFQDSVSTSLNMFRSTIFRYKENKNLDPFKKNNVKASEEELDIIRMNCPSISIQKPNNPLMALNYYQLVYDDPTFKDSLNNQSGEHLMLQKLCNKKNGIIRFRSNKVETEDDAYEETIFDKLIPESERLKNICEKGVLNVEQTCLYLNYICNALDSQGLIKYLFNKYVSSNLDFVTAMFSIEDSYIDSYVAYRHPVPTMLDHKTFDLHFFNPINLLLCYFFDQTNFLRDGRILPKPELVSHDLKTLLECHPDVFLMIIHKLHFWPNSNENIKSEVSKFIKRFNDDPIVNINMGDKLQDGIKQQRDLFSLLRRSNDELYLELNKIYSDEIADYSKNYMSNVLNLNVDDELTMNVGLSNFLKSKSNMAVSRKDRVVFLPPTRFEGIIGVVVSFLEHINSTSDQSPVIKFQQKKLEKLVRQKVDPFELRRNQDMAASIISNLYSFLCYMGLGDSYKREIITKLEYKEFTISSLKKDFFKISPRAKRLLLIPLALFSGKEEYKRLINQFDPLFQTWTVAQDKYNDPYDVTFENANASYHLVSIGGGKLEKGQIVIKKRGLSMQTLFEELLDIAFILTTWKRGNRTNKGFIWNLLRASEDPINKSNYYMLSINAKYDLQLVGPGKRKQSEYRLISGLILEFTDYDYQNSHVDWSMPDPFTIEIRSGNQVHRLEHVDNPKVKLEGLIEDKVFKHGAKGTSTYIFGMVKLDCLFKTGVPDSVICGDFSYLNTNQIVDCLYQDHYYNNKVMSEIKDFVNGKHSAFLQKTIVDRDYLESLKKRPLLSFLTMACNIEESLDLDLTNDFEFNLYNSIQSKFKDIKVNIKKQSYKPNQKLIKVVDSDYLIEHSDHGFHSKPINAVINKTIKTLNSMLDNSEWLTDRMKNRLPDSKPLEIYIAINSLNIIKTKRSRKAKDKSDKYIINKLDWLKSEILNYPSYKTVVNYLDMLYRLSTYIDESDDEELETIDNDEINIENEIFYPHSNILGNSEVVVWDNNLVDEDNENQLELESRKKRFDYLFDKDVGEGLSPEEEEEFGELYDEFM